MQHWVIVGAGSAGCVLAARLSESGERRVTLLDDGPPLAAGEVPPAIAGSNFFAALDEPGRTHADLVAVRTTGRAPVPYQRGRGVGGSSAVNAMVAKDINPHLLDSWGWGDAAAAADRVLIPRTVAQPDELGAVDRALLAACPEAQPASLTRRDRRRVTSAEAYLWPNLDRANLSVRPHSRVDRVMFDGRRAVGVLVADGELVDADEVVMCAGAIHSPAILLRSGVDAPGLGEHLQDHPSVALTLVLRPDAADDATGHTGLALGSLLETDVGGETIQLLPMNHLGAGAPGLGLLMVALMTPHGAAGSVRVDASGDPLIDFALLDEDRDLRALVAGLRLAIDVVTRSPFEDIVERVAIDAHGTTIDALTDDGMIAAWIGDNIADYVHASGTCGMGRTVDRSGRVVGYDSLFVADASVFPSIPDVNTHLPTTMLAEMLCLRGMMDR